MTREFHLAQANLELLRSEGPSPEAFTLRRAFPSPGLSPSTPPEVDAELCGGGPRGETR